MNELDLMNLLSELVKQSIDNNPNFSEWEKWWRKAGIEQTKELAKAYYNQQHPLKQEDKNGFC